jgi:hypothetical protein
MIFFGRLRPVSEKGISTWGTFQKTLGFRISAIQPPCQRDRELLPRYKNALEYFASEWSYFHLFPSGRFVTWQERCTASRCSGGHSQVFVLRFWPSKLKWINLIHDYVFKIKLGPRVEFVVSDCIPLCKIPSILGPCLVFVRANWWKSLEYTEIMINERGTDMYICVYLCIYIYINVCGMCICVYIGRFVEYVLWYIYLSIYLSRCIYILLCICI